MELAPEGSSSQYFGNNSYQNFTDDGDDNERGFIPYETPDCPAGSRLYPLSHLPDETIQTFLYTMTDKVMITIILPGIIVLGLFTNFAFLFTLVKVREMRTITNFYLANLAFADLMFVIVVGVKNIYKYIWSPDVQRGDPWKTVAGCSAINVATYTSYFASIWLITLVSIERFLAICYPLKHRMINTKSRTVKVVLATWVTAISFTAIVAPRYTNHQTYCIIWPEKWQNRLPTALNFCNSIKWQFFDIASIFQFVPFILALFGNSLLYGLIIRRLSQREVSDKSGSKSQAERVRNMVARMLVINGIAFFLCLSPFQFYNMYYFVRRNCSGNCKVFDDRNMYILGWFGRCSSALNSAINPIIYGAINARYRQAFRKALLCDSKKQNIMSGKGVATETTSRM